MKIGIHGRNDTTYRDIDIEYAAKFQSIKMMSHTDVAIYKKIKELSPNIEIITRLYDDRFGVGVHPTPDQYVNKHIPVIEALSNYSQVYQITNEPNHVHKYEGWGSTDEEAKNFNGWYIKVLSILKEKFPKHKFVFPGLALPDILHRDLSWLKICKPSIDLSDRLGCHTYWQSNKLQNISGLTSLDFGERYKIYHELYPNKVIDILECGNSNIQNNINISEEDISQEYNLFLSNVKQYSYINSVNFFILSSPDIVNWNFFSFIEESGRVKSYVDTVISLIQNNKITENNMNKINTTSDTIVTNQLVINALKWFSNLLGNSDWKFLEDINLDLAVLAKNRNLIYEDSIKVRYDLIISIVRMYKSTNV